MSDVKLLKQELVKLRRDIKWNNEKIKELKQNKIGAKARMNELKAEIEKSADKS